MSEINESYLMRVYEDMMREHQKLLGEFKAGNGDEKKLQKQITLLTNLTMSILKLRNVRKTE
jgi:hypothetical protein